MLYCADRRRDALEVAGRAAALAAQAALDGAVADRQGDDVALAGAVGAAAAIEVALVDGGAHDVVELARARDGASAGQRPRCAAANASQARRSAVAAADQAAVRRRALRRGVEGAHDRVELALRRRGARRSRAAAGGGSKRGGVPRRVEPAHVDHVRGARRAVVVVRPSAPAAARATVREARASTPASRARASTTISKPTYGVPCASVSGRPPRITRHGMTDVPCASVPAGARRPVAAEARRPS